MIISWYLQKNGEDDVDDDIDYVDNDVLEKDITDNDTVGSNQNDDGYDVGIDDEDDDDDDGSHWCLYWDCGCLFAFSMIIDTYCYFCDYPSS